MKNNSVSGFIMVLGLLSFVLFVSLLVFLIPVTEAQTSTKTNTDETPSFLETTTIASSTEVSRKYVLVFLDTMSLELHDGNKLVKTIPIISIGKPGSYYETPGGIYIQDYKEELHFSSIGHVYMPYSTHIFGNFFIHGIPYYPNGEKVSSNYSGGCIRLLDTDAEYVYDFIEKGSQIIITKKILTQSNIELLPRDVTRLMVAVISLEFLTQDNPVIFIATTTRRALLNDMLIGNTHVATFYANSLGKETFLELMNTKARSIGLTDTVFTDITTDAKTTRKDTALLYNYLINYKSYLLATSTLSN